MGGAATPTSTRFCEKETREPLRRREVLLDARLRKEPLWEVVREMGRELLGVESLDAPPG